MTAYRAETLPGLTRALADVTKDCAEIIESGDSAVISVKKGSKKRTDEQNSVINVWYGEVAEQLGDRSALDVRCESKLLLGVPILRAEDPEFLELYDGLIKRRFNYEEKLKLMRSFPVTSLMNTKQLSLYMDLMQDHWGESGVKLIVKNKDYDNVKWSEPG